MRIEGTGSKDIDYEALLNETMRYFGDDDNEKTTIKLPFPEGFWKQLPGHFFHLNYEVFMQTEGGCIFHFPEEDMTIKENDILIVPPGMPHLEEAFSSQRRAFQNVVFTVGERYITIHVAGTYPEGKTPKIPERHYVRKINPAKARLYHSMIHAAAQIRPDASPDEKKLQKRLMRTVCQAALIDLSDSDYNPPVDEAATRNRRIGMVIELIRTHMHSRCPTVAELAEKTHCTPNYLSGLFRKETGESLKNYINRAKMEHAKNLLEYTPYNISEIAWSCGFQDAAYFARLFRKHFKCNPHELQSRSVRVL